jgi:peptide/nickel transport system ATP-binding protein
MTQVSGEPGHDVRCRRWQEIDWDSYHPEGVGAGEMEAGEVVLSINDMKKYYEITDNSIGALISGKRVKYVKANESITLDARACQTVAVVGESGCGKSTFAKVLMGLEPATEGKVVLDNQELGNLPVQQWKPQTIGHLQMVFQNPFDTLNPSHSVGSQIARVIRKFGVESDPAKIRDRVLNLLDVVKLPRDFYFRRPRQLSGGQKQRVGIARAFAGNPRVVVADEPVSALDVSVQAAVTQLLTEIQNENRTTLLFISHDLSLVRYLADRVIVMYLGTIAEQGTTDEVFAPPYHPYTEALLSAVPIADTSVAKKNIVLEGDIPSAVNPPPGCPFQTRCPRKIGKICETEAPPIRTFGNGHNIACHIDPAELEAMEPVIVTGKQAAE